MNDYEIRMMRITRPSATAVAKSRENMEQLAKVTQFCEFVLSPLMLLREYNISK